MANRRKRKQRIADKAHNQKMLDELALALASEGVTQTVAKPVQAPLSFSIQSHLDGSDKDPYWPNKLGWLQHRAGYKSHVMEFHNLGGLDSEHDPVNQMLEDLENEDPTETLPADDEE